MKFNGACILCVLFYFIINVLFHCNEQFENYEVNFVAAFDLDER